MKKCKAKLNLNPYKQNSPRCDTAKSSVPSRAIVFACKHEDHRKMKLSQVLHIEKMAFYICQEQRHISAVLNLRLISSLFFSAEKEKFLLFLYPKFQDFICVASVLRVAVYATLCLT